MSKPTTTGKKGKDAGASKFYQDEPVSGLEAEELLSMARLKLMADMPFFGKIAANMPLIENNNFPTTAVDVKGRFYFNRKWVNGMTLDDAVFEFGHETMHIVQRCFSRMPKGANPGIWNMAADYLCDVPLIDAGFEQSKISEKMIGEKEIALVNELGMIEPIYMHLFQKAKDEAAKNGCKGCQQMLGMTDDAKSEEDKAEKAENKSIQDMIDEEMGKDSPGEGEPGEGDAGDGHSHGDEGDPCESNAGGSGGGQPLEPHTCGNVRQCCVGSTADFGQGASPMDEQKWKEVVISAKMHAEAKGNMPAGLGAAIDSLTKSTVRWQDYLKTAATKVFGRDRYSYKRYNRRGRAMNVRLPKAVPDGKSAVIAIDTSGSMSDADVRQCVTESAEIFKQCGASKLFLILHDMRVYYAGEVTVGDLTEIKMARGGTSHQEVFEILGGGTITHGADDFKLPDNTDVELAVMFTDLGTDFPDHTPKYDVLWGVPEDGCPGMSASVPFGKKILVDLAKGE